VTVEDEAIVFVVDDDPSVGGALDGLLRSVGLKAQSFTSTEEFRQSPRPDAPSCLVLDVRMPGQSGLEFQRELAATGEAIPIIFITGHGDIAMSVQAMKAGAIEFLTKPFRDQDLIDAIHLGLDKSRAWRQQSAVTAEIEKRHGTLTPGEKDTMALIVSGLITREIAAKLAVSEITVKVRRSHIMRKMQAASLPELVRMADRLTRQAEDGPATVSAGPAAAEGKPQPI
jgi:FixJ family two-component response regulator